MLRISSELVFVIIYSYFRFELSRISGLMNSGNFFQIIKQRSFLETYYNCDSDSKLLSKIASSCQIESSYWKKFTRVSTVKFSSINPLKVRSSEKIDLTLPLKTRTSSFVSNVYISKRERERKNHNFK